MEAVFTVTLPATEEVLKKITEINEFKKLHKGWYYDWYTDDFLNKQLELKFNQGKDKLLKEIKRAGYVTVENPDISYGWGGDKTEFWYQAQAERK